MTDMRSVKKRSSVLSRSDKSERPFLKWKLRCLLRVLPALLLLLCFGNCGKKNAKNTAGAWPEVSAGFETMFVIGADTTDFLIAPGKVVTDSRGRIIIADQGQNKLLVFDGHGDFLYSMGSKGRGPDEFMMISGMGITPEDTLVVFDVTQKLFKRFESSGKYSDTKVPSGILLNNSLINIEFRDGHPVIIAGIMKNRSQPERQAFVHILSDDYQFLSSGVTSEELGTDPVFAELYSISKVSYILENDILYYVPYLYDGRIYTFRLTEENDTFKAEPLAVATQGLVYMNPVEVLSGSRSPRADIRVTFAGGGSRQYLAHNLSRGFFRLKNGNFVHFTFVESADKKERVFGVELYTPKLEPIAYAPLKTVRLSDNAGDNTLSWHVDWKDEKDIFYIIEQQPGGAPLVRAAKLQFDTE